MYRWGLRRGHSQTLELHTMEFQAEIYAIKACIMENTEEGYTGRSIYFLSDRQAAIKGLKSFQMKFQITVGLPSICGEIGRT
jgi:predicted RNA binding protein with dsRBD fold (UPF0201 family)